ncbi:MAG TPA: signal peptidase I [Polyangiales bacterium]|nr:signal peptidase I [Polyangiales bacterium]
MQERTETPGDEEKTNPEPLHSAHPPISHAERLWDLAKTLVVSLSLAVAVRVGIAQAYEVDGPSMEPTLLTGEKLFVARCAYGLALPWLSDALVSWSLPEVGDVVILASPQDPTEDLVKRVIGLPGDLIEVRDDTIYRNAKPLPLEGPHVCPPGRFRNRYSTCETYTESSELHHWSISRSLEWGQTLPAVRVPKDHIYVLGDHRTRSNDSRAFGPVRASLLRGKVLFMD